MAGVQERAWGAAVRVSVNTRFWLQRRALFNWSPFYIDPYGWDSKRPGYRLRALPFGDYLRLLRDRLTIRTSPLPPKPNKVLVIEIEPKFGASPLPGTTVDTGYVWRALNRRDEKL